MFDQASDMNTPERISGISVLVTLIGDQYESLTETDIHRVSEKKTSKIIFIITTSIFHQIW